EVGKRAWPAAGPSAKDHLQRFALPLVRPLVEEQPHRRFRLPFPHVALERAKSHDAQSFEAHVAIVSLANVPRQDAFADVVSGRLSERARTGDAAVAGVEPVSGDTPAGNIRHNSSVSSESPQRVGDYRPHSAREHPHPGGEQEGSADLGAAYSK